MIFDCFNFFNEFDLLELRMRTLWDVVDYFVAVESPVTFNGQPKPLHLQDAMANGWCRELQPNLHVFVANPDVVGTNKKASMERVRQQQDMMPYACRRLGAKRDDLLLLSDVDEIPRPERIIAAMNILEHGEDGRTHRFVSLQQHICYYYLNLYRGPKWQGTCMAKMKDIPKRFSEMRLITRGTRGRTREGRVLYDAGWHFTFMGGAEAVSKKIRSYAHTEWDRPQFTDVERIKQRMREGRDPFERYGDVTMHAVPLSCMPREVQENPDRWSHMLLDPKE